MCSATLIYRQNRNSSGDSIFSFLNAITMRLLFDCFSFFFWKSPLWWMRSGCAIRGQTSVNTHEKHKNVQVASAANKHSSVNSWLQFGANLARPGLPTAICVRAPALALFGAAYFGFKQCFGNSTNQQIRIIWRKRQFHTPAARSFELGSGRQRKINY